MMGRFPAAALETNLMIIDCKRKCPARYCQFPLLQGQVSVKGLHWLELVPTSGSQWFCEF